ncbi:methyltransferase RsmF C-terminal domain-like protein [Cyclobacterium xiamenense]|uniref:methyltransferase RsmF C-terminal domain-like protein n=1 Tax=Cyclobacterium xiamenense TaxID=1297121 RepID=UPI0012B91D79|nr:tRNA/rRNA cytosine-C5-methylase [Cyclobacterium xiamenense]
MNEYPLPSHFLEAMKQQLGESDLNLFLQALQQPAPVSIRLNPSKGMSAPAASEPVGWSPHAFLLQSRPSFTLDPYFHAGAYYVQEASSGFLNHVLNQLELPEAPLALDLCAAPGGKSTLISSFLGEKGLLLANEVIKSRNLVLKENTIKWGLGNTVITQNDPAHFAQLSNSFDFVLVDAPCSGEGLFRKDPQSIQEWSPENVHLCQGRQSRILQEAAALPKPEGYLIYSTCTYNSLENEENIRFLVANFGYKPVEIPIDPSWGISQSACETERGAYPVYRFYPHRVPGEGLFMAVLQRPPSEDYRKPAKMGKDFRHPHLQRLPGKIRNHPSFPTLDLAENFAYYQYSNHLFALPARWVAWFETIATRMNVQYFGVELGDWARDTFLPGPAWALSLLPKPSYAVEELTTEEAIRYLKKEPITLSKADRGWVLVNYKGLGMGWVKNLGNRSNNYYPKEWRIRMD